MSSGPFLFYNPGSGSDSRQQDLFTPQPTAILRSTPVNPQDAAMQFYMHPIATPKPMSHRPGVLIHDPQVLSLETEFAGFDEVGYPRTPGLSTASSAVSSPPQSSYLPTPTSGFFENLLGVKEGCELEVKSEILGNGHWTRAGSPPLTPVYVLPPSVTRSQASDRHSTASCPSLSPSPSPAPQSIVSEHESFCDPRNLLKSVPLINQRDIPTLPAFVPSNDDLLLGVTLATPCKSEDMSASFESIAPIFDNLSDLDSDNDFITDLSQDSALYLGAKRQRLASIPFSEDLSEASFDDELSMSFDSHVLDAKHTPVETSSLDFVSFAGGNDAGTAEVAVPAQEDGQDATAMTPSADSGNSAQQQTNRRGRKQSLTDDPSKTFVCTLCSRRFRRQEHLKRHYRSLHTHDKPFECSDCGKKFSRSDNLAQHARTHGNTTTIVGLGMPELDEKTASMGNVLFETAAAVGSSSSSSGSDDEKAAKKRKRDE